MGRKKKTDTAETKLATIAINDSTDWIIDSHVTINKHKEDLENLNKEITGNVTDAFETLNGKINDNTEIIKGKLNDLDVEIKSLNERFNLQKDLLNATIKNYIKTTKLFIFIDILFVLAIFGLLIFK